MEAPRLLRLADGRVLAFDDVGAADGVPVVYLHGTPDSRLARHPDDSVAAAVGVRLIAVDRPGAGQSDLDATGTLTSLGADVGALLDHLALDEACLLGWSAGGLCALSVAGTLGERVRAVGLVGSLPPVEAYADPQVVAALGEARRAFVEMAMELTPRALAAEVASFLVPHPLTEQVALEHVLESAGADGRDELASVSGAAEQLARALVAAVTGGLAGVEHDLALQLEPDLDLGHIRAPVRSFHGTRDSVSPPEVGAWLVARMPHAVLDRVPEAGHHLLFPRWRGVLRAIVRDAGTT